MSGEREGEGGGRGEGKEGSTLYLLRVMGEEGEHQYLLPGRRYRWNLITVPAVVTSPNAGNCTELHS